MLGIGAMNAFHLKMKMENKNAGIGLRCRNFSLVKHRLSFYNDRLHCKIQNFQYTMKTKSVAK